MMMIKLSGADGRVLCVAARALAVAAVAENKHKKEREAAKTIIGRELQRLRGVNHAELPEKEIVMVSCDGEEVLKIERKGSERLDAAALGAEHPELVDEFTGTSVASYFSSLLKDKD